MNNKFPFISLLFFFVFLAGAVYLTLVPSNLKQAREKMYAGMEQQLKQVYLPVSGFEKFYADAHWVALVQKMADNDMIGSRPGEKLSEEEEKALRLKHSTAVYQRLERLSDIDPNNERLYDIGAMCISSDMPKEAMNLLKKGDRLLKNPSYKYPFSQYCILNNMIALDEKQKAAKRPEMIELLDAAKDRTGAPVFVQNQWLRLQAEAKGYDDDSVGRLRLWQDYYLSKVKASCLEDETVSGDKNAECYDGFSSTDQGTALQNQIMSMAQNMALENFKKRQKAKGAELKKLQAEHKEIKQIFFSVAPSNGHYSEESLHPYAPGDLFDVHTGTKVKPYGVDPDMLAQGRVVVYKGQYSQITGKPRNENYSKFKHEDFVKAFQAANK